LRPPAGERLRDCVQVPSNLGERVSTGVQVLSNLGERVPARVQVPSNLGERVPSRVRILWPAGERVATRVQVLSPTGGRNETWHATQSTPGRPGAARISFSSIRKGSSSASGGKQSCRAVAVGQGFGNRAAPAAPGKRRVGAGVGKQTHSLVEGHGARAAQDAGHAVRRARQHLLGKLAGRVGVSEEVTERGFQNDPLPPAPMSLLFLGQAHRLLGSGERDSVEAYHEAAIISH
jgi:hypothetical protein